MHKGYMQIWKYFKGVVRVCKCWYSRGNTGASMPMATKDSASSENASAQSFNSETHRTPYVLESITQVPTFLISVTKYLTGRSLREEKATWAHSVRGHSLLLRGNHGHLWLHNGNYMLLCLVSSSNLCETGGREQTGNGAGLWSL